MLMLRIKKECCRSCAPWQWCTGIVFSDSFGYNPALLTGFYKSFLSSRFWLPCVEQNSPFCQQQRSSTLMKKETEMIPFDLNY
jgi:hypothetical protein